MKNAEETNNPIGENKEPLSERWYTWAALLVVIFLVMWWWMG
jgi:hypothetical protein